ncbi:UNVERIFIED_CONTAM: hypothetical protein Scaly_2975600 [Sesamum calycinum]|uniref:Uncharacterized protein n=1 Tax=Sesamum calycinum TaxID=2727403 RepID=A0AAW2KNT1_9LAMI
MTPCPTSSRTSTQALGHRADLVRSTGHNPGQPSEFYPATTKITAQPPLEQLSKMEKIRLRTGGKEERRKGKEWKRLRERFAKESWRGEKFPVGVSDPPGLHLLVEEVGFLDIKVSRQSKKATSGSNRCFDHDSLLPVRACCHAGKSRGFGQFYLLLDLNQ